jgi:hypothetical protein
MVAASPSESLILALWGTIFAPLVVALIVWVVSSIRRQREERRRRRRRILGLMDQARSLVFRGIRDGLYEQSWIEESLVALQHLQERYDDLTVEALSRFEQGEEDVAHWTAIEFYAGFRDPLRYLDDRGIPRRPDPDGWPLITYEAEGVDMGDEMVGYLLPRPEMLVDWAEGRPGPLFGTAEREGDVARHNIVRPNSDSAMDMLRAPVELSRRRRRRGRRS